MAEELNTYALVETTPPETEYVEHYPIVLQSNEYSGVMLHALIQETIGIKDVLAPEMAFVQAKKQFERATFYIPPLEKDMLQFYEATVRMFDNPTVAPIRPKRKSDNSNTPFEDDAEDHAKKLIYHLHPDTIDEDMAQALGSPEGCAQAFRDVVKARKTHDIKALNSLFAQIMPVYYKSRIESLIHQEGMNLEQIAARHPEMFEDLLSILNNHIVRQDRVTNTPMPPEEFQMKAESFRERAETIIAAKNAHQQVDALKHIIGMAGKIEKARSQQGYLASDPYRIELKRVSAELRILQRELWQLSRSEAQQGRQLAGGLKEQISGEIRTIGSICFQNAQRMSLRSSAPDLHLDIATLSERIQMILTSIRYPVAL